MAGMKLALRVRKVSSGFEVKRWDYALRGWVLWKGIFQATEMGMRGSYRLRYQKGALFLRRYTVAERQKWEQPLPEGVSAWDAEGGGPVVLPWLQPDMLDRVLAISGIGLNYLVRQPDSVRELTVDLPSGTNAYGQKYYTYVDTDGERIATEQGVRVRSPSYAIEYMHLLDSTAHKDLREGRWVRAIHVWPDTPPRVLMKALHKVSLSHSMSAWESDLYFEEFKMKK